MSDQPVKHNEIIEPKVFQPAADSADILLEKLSLLIGGFKELAKITGAKINSGIDPKTLSDVDKLAAAKERLANIEKGLTDIQKVEVEIRAKQKKANKDLQDQLKAQDGILGQLLIKKKQLQEGLLSAKTKDEIKTLNQELFKTNGQIKNIKEGGTGAFNSWGNAVQSFQFKFNALGSAIGGMVAGAFSGLVSTIVDFGIQGAKAFYETAKASGLFGKSIQDSTVNTAALQGALDAVEKQLARIGKSQREIVADALGFGLEAKRLELESALRGANDIKTEGLSDEDKKKVLDQRQEIADQIAALDAEVELKRIDFKKKSIEEQVRLTKDGTDKELAAVRLGFEQQLSLLLGGKDKSGTQDERLVRVEALNKAIDDINIEQGKRSQERKDKVAKKDLDDAKKAGEDAAALKKKLAQEDVERVRNAFELERKYEIEALTGKFGEAEQIIAKQSVETKIALGIVLPDELQAYNEQIAKEKDDARKKELKDTEDLINEKKKINDEFIKYNIDALDGSFGEAERKIARQSLATKIAMNTATPEEVKAWNELIKKENDKAADEKKKQLEENIKTAEGLSDAAFEGMKERNDKDLQQNADKITELDRQIAFQRELALKGEVNSLQEVEKARAEALAEKAALEKKAANQAKGEKAAEIFLEFYKAYANEKEGAFMKALTATARGKGGEAIVKALFSGSFKEGTEDTGGRGTLDKDGGKAAIIHPHERILTAEQNAKIGKISNEDLANSVWRMNNVYPNLDPVSDERSDIQLASAMIGLVREEMKKQTKAIENPPYIDFQRNAMNEIIEMDRKLGQLTQTTHKRIGASYSRD